MRKARPPGVVRACAALLPALLAACAGDVPTQRPQRTPERIQADIAALIPASVAQRAAWAVDLQLVFAGLKLEPTTDHVCAVLAVTEQESTYNPDPPVPDLARIARAEILRRAGQVGVPAHLLGYEAPAYGTTMIYRFADFNAEQHASRNAAFQQALAAASGQALELDGDLVVSGSAQPGQTELAARSLGAVLGMDDRAIRRELERSNDEDFDRSPLLAKVMALAESRTGRPQPRAVLPRIVLKSPKITRLLTTEWFARRVDERYRRCRQAAAG